MTIVRWNPWREIDTLQRSLNHIFDDSVFPTTWKDLNDLKRIPAAELSETEEAFHLKLEVPGINASDLDIQATKNVVSISGDRKSQTKTEEENYTRSEFNYGKFERVISLPSDIQNTKVEADYKDGILHLTLPKTDEEKNKVVKINIDETTA